MPAHIDAITPERLARPSFGINHVLAYGQSLSCGWDGWPILSTTPRHDSLMLGQSVHPKDHEAPSWSPIGPPRFHPLIASMQTLGSGHPLETGQPSPGDTAVGETILETALNEWRRRALSAGDATIGLRRLLASSCGVGGRSIEELSADATPNLFQRLRHCAETARDAAHAIGQSYGIVALVLLQGEANNLALGTATDDAKSYTSLLRNLCTDFRADAYALTSCPSPPAIFTYQTGGAYATDTNPIPQAQLDVALESPGLVMVSPVYYLPHTSSGHLDANGYRWLGAQFGKVMHRVLHRGEIFRPTHPIHAWCNGARVTIAFHVPEPPLAWGNPYPGNPSAGIANRGFVVSDDLGGIPILSVKLIGSETLQIDLERAPAGQAVIRYASAATAGRGCLHDSDADQSTTRYTLNPKASTGFQTPAPELGARPYALRNWCAAFTLKTAAAG